MKSQLKFTFWIDGEPTSKLFQATISPTESVSALQALIKTTRHNTLSQVEALDLDLFCIPAPPSDQLHAVLTNWNHPPKVRLDVLQQLSAVHRSFAAPGKPPVIIAKLPSSHPPQPTVVSSEFTLNCWRRGQPTIRVFPIRISNTQAVGDLKDAIKDKKSPELDHIAADALTLYKVSFPYGDETLADFPFHHEQPLSPVETLHDVFLQPPVHKYVHIVFEAPPADTPEAPLLPTHPRIRYIQAWDYNKMTPSVQGQPVNFKALQSTDRRVEWSRPPVATSTIPVTLLHSVFGQFVNDCHNHDPTSEDNSLALDLNCEMSKFFNEEGKRRDAIINIFRNHGIEMMPSSLSRYITDGDLHVNGRRYTIMEVKNEVGSKGAEPYCQAVLYYIAATKSEVKEAFSDEVLFNFPCLIITLFGPHISFSGATWADRPNYQVLSTTLPLFPHPTDDILRRCISRHLGAFKNACRTLRELYEKFNKMPSSFKNLQPQFPHPRAYTEFKGQDQVHFSYVNALQNDKLLFVIQTGTGEHLCVKFTQAYSLEVHCQCADWGISPQLRGYDAVPGGWKMVVMDLLDARNFECLSGIKESFTGEQRGGLIEGLRSRLAALHQLNLVHGDVRDANVMVSKNRLDWRLVDFDWSGEIGQVRYPMNVNRGRDLQRPDGAIDGRLILADHDINMLDYLF